MKIGHFMKRTAVATLAVGAVAAPAAYAGGETDQTDPNTTSCPGVGWCKSTDHPDQAGWYHAPTKDSHSDCEDSGNMLYAWDAADEYKCIGAQFFFHPTDSDNGGDL